MAKTKKTAAKQDESMAFSFGDPEPVISGSLTDYLGVFLLDNGSYYTPPVSLSGLARLRGANAYHGPLLEFKTNMILKDIILSQAVPFSEILPFTTDFVTFMNAYFQKIKNRLGEVVYLRHL
ncbi:MAG: hypothetical protein WBB23_17165, partial [Desulforhopalus sp.]